MHFGYNLNLCTPLDKVVEVLIWSDAVLNGRQQISTEPLHDKSPGRPKRAGSPYVIGQMEERVDGEGASWEAGCLILIVIPTHRYTLVFVDRVIRHIYILFVLSYPLINHLLEFINLCARDLELEAPKDYLSNE